MFSSCSQVDSYFFMPGAVRVDTVAEAAVGMMGGLSDWEKVQGQQLVQVQ